MAKIVEFMERRDQWIEERYELIRERMDEMVGEDMSRLFLGAYLQNMTTFLRDALRVYDLKAAQMTDTLSVVQQKGIHDQLYHAPIWEQYGTLSDACWNAGEEWGPLLWAVGQEWRGTADYALGGERFLLTIAVELFLQVYQLFCMEQSGEIDRKELYESVRQAVYSHFSDYCDVTAALVYHDRFYPGEFQQQLLEAGAEDHYGLYRLGGQVDDRAQYRRALWENEGGSCDQETLKKLADQVMEAAGFPVAGEALSTDQVRREKNRISLYVPMGFEALGQLLWHRLTGSGYEVVCLRRRRMFMARIAELRPIEELPELPLFWDRGLKDRRITEEKNALDGYRKWCETQLSVLDLEMLVPMQQQRQGELEESPIHLTHTLKHDHIYEQFRAELQELRRCR